MSSDGPRIRPMYRSGISGHDSRTLERHTVCAIDVFAGMPCALQSREQLSSRKDTRITCLAHCPPILRSSKAA
jgi:hypothetical protein